MDRTELNQQAYQHKRIKESFYISRHAKNCAWHHSFKSDDCDCDGSLTFDELYKSNKRLFITLIKSLNAFNLIDNKNVVDLWCSTTCFDDIKPDGYFFCGINTAKGEQITFMLEVMYWPEVSKFCQVLSKAPQHDGHTFADVLDRLYNLISVY